MSNEGALKYVTKEMLEDLYWGQRLSLPKVANLFGVTVRAIVVHMKKHNLPFRSISEAKKGCIPWNKGLTAATDSRMAQIGQNISESLAEGLPRRPSRYWLGKTHSDETKEKLSEMGKGKGNHFFGKHHSDNTKKVIGEKARQRWQSPEYAARIMAARNIRPNKAEEALKTFLDTYFPGDYEYTGDGSLVIRGMIPDFANCNGKKEVIELFGNYFHSEKIIGDRWYQTELGRIMAFNSLGFRCLVIWEDELKAQDKLLEKIRVFREKEATHGR